MPHINCTILHWSKEKNEEVFGECANENWHGHNFDLFVTVKGKPDKDTGFVMDVKQLSHLIKEHVIEKLDHKNLNLDVDFLTGKMCSYRKSCNRNMEATATAFAANVTLHCIKLYETPRIYVEYFGEIALIIIFKILHENNLFIKI